MSRRVTWKLTAEHIRDALVVYFDEHYPEVKPMSVDFQMTKLDAVTGKGELNALVDVELQPEEADHG